MSTPRIRLRTVLAATAAAGLLGLTGCGSDLAPVSGSASATPSPAAPSSEAPTEESSATPTPVPTPVPAEVPASDTDATPTPKLDWGGPLAPGAFGDIEAKGNVRALVKRGWVTRDTAREKVCEGTYWKWVDQVGDGVDLTYDPQGEIASFGMSKPVLKTAEGLTIGSTLRDLQDSYEAGSLRTNDYGQPVFVARDVNSWIGFLLTGRSGDAKVDFIEVTNGHEPGLLRDGC